MAVLPAALSGEEHDQNDFCDNQRHHPRLGRGAHLRPHGPARPLPRCAHPPDARARRLRGHRRRRRAEPQHPAPRGWLARTHARARPAPGLSGQRRDPRACRRPRNLGWRAAQAPVVAFTGDDAVPSGAWLAEALDLFSDDVDVLCGGVDAPQSAARHGAAPAQPSVTPPTLCPANCFCRKSVLEALDGFDERFSEACHDDADLHFRLLDVHARIVHAPQARVVQPVLPPRWGESLGQARRAVFDALLYKKHPHLYRAHIGAAPPWDDYLATAAPARHTWRLSVPA
nr:hypothetical protein [Massilia sp. Se16.2.3]